MSPTILPTAKPQPSLDGRHVLTCTVAFFGVVFAVNGVLLYQALSTHSGLVAQEPYRKGLAYNTRIAAGERQAALGWTTELTTAPDGRVVLTAADRLGLPVAGLKLSGTIGRPSTNRRDVTLRFVEQTAGRYLAEAGALGPGAWQIDVEARENNAERASGAATNDPVYRARSRLWLKP